MVCVLAYLIGRSRDSVQIRATIYLRTETLGVMEGGISKRMATTECGIY